MSKQDNKERFVYRHRFAAFFFLYTVLYNFLIVNRMKFWQVTNITYAYHLVDYRTLGFRSNILPGAIYNAIFGSHFSRTTATIYETVLLLLFFLGVAVFLERFLGGVEQQHKRSAFFLILFYLSGSFTFSAFADELGMLDVYWLFFSLIFFFLLEKRGLRFLIPVLFVLSLLVHFSAVLNDLILFSVLLLYRVSMEAEKKNRRAFLLIFTLSVTATAGLFVFFLFNHAKDLPISMEEFNRMLQDKGSDYTLYYDYSFYNTYGGEDVVPSAVFSVESPVWRVLQVIFYKCLFNLKIYVAHPLDTAVRLGYVVFLLGPLLVLFYRHLHLLFRNSKDNRLKRFSVFLMMVQFPFTGVVGCLFSPDIVRWFTHAFLILFTTVLYVVSREEDVRLRIFDEIDRLKRASWTWVYFLAYSLAHSWPYC